MNQFFERMMAGNPMGLTENGAATHTTTGNACLNYFALAGAKRKDQAGVRKLFEEAYLEDPQIATRLAFYMRDIRGGQGERDVFFTSIDRVVKDLIDHDRCIELVRLFGFFPVYGRWKDLVDLTLAVSEIKPTIYSEGHVSSLMGEIFAIQLLNDYRNILEAEESMGKVTVSLLAKWLPSINASSPTTRKKAQFIARSMGMDPIRYRRVVRAVREALGTVEEKMSGGGWADIEYSKVPSRASMIYRKAFARHDSARYTKFVEAAKAGTVKINSSTLYPYELVNKFLQSPYDPDETVEALWKQLPDYTRGKNGIVVADVSGSMSGDPMAVSISLALYFAERNRGAFKDCFITFDIAPQLFKMIPGESLAKRVQKTLRAPWGGSTDIEKVFKLILRTAIDNQMPQEDLPETIYIISDMEFNSCVSNARMTNFQNVKLLFEQAGYKLPNVVFWNVNSRNTNTPVTQNEVGVTLVSGLSPSIFKMVTENKTPLELMLDTVNGPRYNQI